MFLRLLSIIGTTISTRSQTTEHKNIRINAICKLLININSQSMTDKHKFEVDDSTELKVDQEIHSLNSDLHKVCFGVSF